MSANIAATQPESADRIEQAMERVVDSAQRLGNAASNLHSERNALIRAQEDYDSAYANHEDCVNAFRHLLIDELDLLARETPVAIPEKYRPTR